MSSDKLELTALGRFVQRYSTMVPISVWRVVRAQAQRYLDSEQDWRFFLNELAAGCWALGADEELLEIVAQEEVEG